MRWKLFYSSTRDKAEKVTASRQSYRVWHRMEVYMFLLIPGAFREVWNVLNDMSYQESRL